MISGFERRPLSRRGFFKLMRLTLGGILLCVVVSLSLHAWLFWPFGSDVFTLSMISAVVLPLVLAGPLFIFISLKLRQLSQLNRELRHAADHDGLTALLNRSAFVERVYTRIDEIAQIQGGRGALLLIDADFFKKINDRWGHSTGDEVLRQIADRVRAVTRKDDIIGRLGGEEFGVFLPGAGMISATATAERLRSMVEEMRLVAPNGRPVKVSVSVGGLFFRNAITFELMFQKADRKLYDAKANGRNRVEFDEFDPGRDNLAA